MAKIKYTKIYCLDCGHPIKEYKYSVEITSNTGNVYVSYDNWTSYSTTSSEAKMDIEKRLNESQSIDYILDDMIIKDAGNVPYFVPIKN